MQVNIDTKLIMNETNVRQVMDTNLEIGVPPSAPKDPRMDIASRRDNQFIKLVHILLHMINMLGQATWIQLNLNSYLCVRVVINYQKGEIKSSSLVLVN